MLDLLNTVVQWFVSGVENIISLITSIPVYVGYVSNFISLYIPGFMIPYLVLGFSAIVIICIKRLIL